MRRIQGEHTPNNKNISTKQLTWLTKIRPVYKSMNGETLKDMAKRGNYLAEKEIIRREKSHEKTQVRKQRYLEKLEQKRLKK